MGHLRLRTVHTILYVSEQSRSRIFYEQVLSLAPRLDVPGMTEFQLGPKSVLGLMPWSGISHLLRLPGEGPGLGCELYLDSEEAEAMLSRALVARGRLLSPFLQRDWGARVAYVADPDGHVLALADSEAQ